MRVALLLFLFFLPFCVLFACLLAFLTPSTYILYFLSFFLTYFGSFAVRVGLPFFFLFLGGGPAWVAWYVADLRCGSCSCWLCWLSLVGGFFELLAFCFGFGFGFVWGL